MLAEQTNAMNEPAAWLLIVLIVVCLAVGFLLIISIFRIWRRDLGLQSRPREHQDYPDIWKTSASRLLDEGDDPDDEMGTGDRPDDEPPGPNDGNDSDDDDDGEGPTPIPPTMPEAPAISK